MSHVSETLRLLPDRVRLCMTTALCLEQHPKDAVLLEPGDELKKFMVVLSGAGDAGVWESQGSNAFYVNASIAPVG